VKSQRQREVQALPKLDRVRGELGELFPQTSWLRNLAIAVLLPCYNEAHRQSAATSAFAPLWGGDRT
jgi:hypothetical protein